MATRTWDGGGGNDNWSTDANWDTVAPVNGDSVIFAGTTRLTPNNDISSLSLVDITIASGAGAFNLGGNSITLTGDITNDNGSNQVISMPIVLSNTSHVFDMESGRIEFTGVISGAGGSSSITKTGSNQLRLSAANTFSGGMQWNDGDIRLQDEDGLGTGKVTMDSTGLLRLEGDQTVPNDFDIDSVGGIQSLNGAGDNELSGNILLNTDWEFRNKSGSVPLTLSGVISGTGGLIQDNSYTDIILSGNNTFTGDTEINNGTVVTGHENALRYSPVVLADDADAELDISGQNSRIGGLEGGGASGGNVTLGSSKLTVHATEASPAAYVGIISGTGSIQKNNTGKLILTGLNTYTGETILVQGTLEYNSIGDVSGGASALGNPNSVANGTIELQMFDSVLKYTGTGHESDRVIYLDGAGDYDYWVDASGSGQIYFTSSPTYDTGNKILILTGDGVGKIVGIPDNGGDVITLQKEGSGRWINNGINAYTGPTNINAGALQIDYDNSAATGLTTVSSGAVLGGHGNMYCPVTINNGGILSPSMQGATGAETLSTDDPTIILSNTSLLDFILGTVSDKVEITGALTLDGFINVTAGAGFAPGAYTILDYTGALTNNGLTVGTLPVGYSAIIDTSIANQVDLIISVADGHTTYRGVRRGILNGVE